MKFANAIKSLIASAILGGLAFSAAASPDDAVLERGKELFVSKAVPACAICHALSDAGASGAIGPDLDELKPDADRIKKAMRDGIGAMPSFAATMSAEDMDAVAAYVVKATGG